MSLIDREVLLEDLKKYKYSKKSLKLIQDQHEVAAIPIYWLIERYLKGTSLAGCKPRYETVKEIINEWYESQGDPAPLL